MMMYPILNSSGDENSGGGSSSTSLVGIQTFKRLTACVIPYNANTALQFGDANYENLQVDGSPVVSATDSQLFVQEGISLLRVMSQFYVGTTAELQIAVYKNGSQYARGRNVGRGTSVDFFVDVASGDVIEMFWFHKKSGGSTVYDPAVSFSDNSPFFASFEGYSS